MKTSFASTFVKLVLPCALALIGCGDGQTTQQAVARCNIERQNAPTVTDAGYAQCIACVEQCGDRCKAKAGSPEVYACE